MNASRVSLPRLFLALLLLFALTADVSASPSPARSHLVAPQAAWFDFMPETGRPTRTTVIRVAAVGMVLALFIMYRNKH